MISQELDALHRLVVSDLHTIAHYRTQGHMINHTVRLLIYGLTGFQFLEGEDKDAPAAKQILEGPTYRVLWRHKPNDRYKVQWLDKDATVQLFDDPWTSDMQFGEVILIGGEIRPINVMEMAEILDLAKVVNM